MVGLELCVQYFSKRADPVTDVLRFISLCYYGMDSSSYTLFILARKVTHQGVWRLLPPSRLVVDRVRVAALVVLASLHGDAVARSVNLQDDVLVAFSANRQQNSVV